MPSTKLPRLNINDLTITPTKEADSLLLLDEKLIKERFKARGVILFRGFDFDVDTFDTFTQRFCASSVHNQSKGRSTIKASANIQTVNLGNAPFALVLSARWTDHLRLLALAPCPTGKSRHQRSGHSDR